MEISDKQAIEIIALIKSHIEEKGNCRVGWAIKQIAGDKFEKSIHILEKVANTIIQSGEYIKEHSLQRQGDFNILKNPFYKKESWTVKHPVKFELLKALINAIISILVAYFTARYVVQDKSQYNSQSLYKPIEILSEPTSSQKQGGAHSGSPSRTNKALH